MSGESAGDLGGRPTKGSDAETESAGDEEAKRLSDNGHGSPRQSIYVNLSSGTDWT
jgi:hypothetical protein